jgi:2-C-methyl-D-erythritol 2,4-cyclodiphosphate synthase
MRVGFGYDVHRLAEDRKLILGGVTIPFEKGLLGHSDADVLLHGIMDALLGAAGMGDIGQHFPDSDPAYEGADSMQLLQKVGSMVSEKGYLIENIDATVIAQAPKIGPYREQMREGIAKALGITPGQVNVKATTEEGLGFTGKGEGISACAVCMLTSPFDLSMQTVGSDCGACGGCPKAGK